MIPEKYDTKRAVIFLFVISIIVRMAFFIYVTSSKMPLLHDENGYFMRAVGFENIIRDILSGRIPSPASCKIAYGQGVWPPIHPLLLGIGLVAFGKHIYSMRLVVLILSAGATPLVYLLTLKLANNKAARCAALIHCFYPGFIAYSHLLWSESTFIFFLLSAVYYSVLLCEADGRRKKLFAVASGVCLGLSCLTRAAGLPYLLVIPLWVWIKERGWKIPVVIALVSLAVLSPWEAALTAARRRVVLISTKAEFNLYLGNNPWVSNLSGSSWRKVSEEEKVKKNIRDYSKLKFVGDGEAARTLAFNEIKGDFTGFLTRCFYRFRMFCGGEFFAMRHIFHAVYPPMSNTAVLLIWCFIIGSYMCVAVLVFLGIRKTSSTLLLALLTAAGTLPSLVTIGMSRLHIPTLALLLPAAGVGAANLRRLLGEKALPAAAAALLVFASIYTTLPIVINVYLVPSSYYADLISACDRVFGIQTQFTDKVILRHVPGRLHINLPANLRLIGGKKVLPVSADGYVFKAKNGLVTLKILSQGKPIVISVFSEKLKKRLLIKPIMNSSWWQWQKTGLGNIEYIWCGNADVPSSFSTPDTLFYRYNA